MSNRIDLLDHPDLSKVWVALESAAPTLELDELPASPEPTSRRRNWSMRRALAAVVVVLVVMFIGTETFGVFSANRAIASGVVVTDGTVDLDLRTMSLSEPWEGLEAPLGLNDLMRTPDGIVGVATGSDNQLESADAADLWLLTEFGWTSLGETDSFIEWVRELDWGATVTDEFISQSATDGHRTVFSGSERGRLEDSPRLWTSDNAGTLQQVDLPSLRTLGFGYLIGGFRLPSIEGVIHTESGFVAYTGYLQLWDGFSDGITLEPEESWASLILTSMDGTEWTPHVLPDFAIYQIVPYAQGMIAAAALPPESNSRVVEEDGETYSVAVVPDNHLYYSDDGLTWSAIADSPALGKPLLATTSDGTVIAVDEWAAEDRTIPTTQIHVITPAP